MNLEHLQKGDIVYANCHIYNDGGIPDLPSDALIAEPGTPGTIVEMGHLEDTPTCKVYLVRFQDKELNLGPPAGCWPEELRMAQG